MNKSVKIVYGEAPNWEGNMETIYPEYKFTPDADGAYYIELGKMENDWSLNPRFSYPVSEYQSQDASGIYNNYKYVYVLKKGVEYTVGFSVTKNLYDELNNWSSESVFPDTTLTIKKAFDWSSVDMTSYASEGQSFNLKQGKIYAVTLSKEGFWSVNNDVPLLNDKFVNMYNGMYGLVSVVEETYDPQYYKTLLVRGKSTIFLCPTYDSSIQFQYKGKVPAVEIDEEKSSADSKAYLLNVEQEGTFFIDYTNQAPEITTLEGKLEGFSIYDSSSSLYGKNTLVGTFTSGKYLIICKDYQEYDPDTADYISKASTFKIWQASKGTFTPGTTVSLAVAKREYWYSSANREEFLVFNTGSKDIYLHGFNLESEYSFGYYSQIDPGEFRKISLNYEDDGDRFALMGLEGGGTAVVARIQAAASPNLIEDQNTSVTQSAISQGKLTYYVVPGSSLNKEKTYKLTLNNMTGKTLYVRRYWPDDEEEYLQGWTSVQPEYDGSATYEFSGSSDLQFMVLASDYSQVSGVTAQYSEIEGFSKTIQIGENYLDQTSGSWITYQLSIGKGEAGVYEVAYEENNEVDVEIYDENGNNWYSYDVYHDGCIFVAQEGQKYEVQVARAFDADAGEVSSFTLKISKVGNANFVNGSFSISSPVTCAHAYAYKATQTGYCDFTCTNTISVRLRDENGKEVDQEGDRYVVTKDKAYYIMVCPEDPGEETAQAPVINVAIDNVGYEANTPIRELVSHMQDAYYSDEDEDVILSDDIEAFIYNDDVSYNGTTYYLHRNEIKSCYQEYKALTDRAKEVFKNENYRAYQILVQGYQKVVETEAAEAEAAKKAAEEAAAKKAAEEAAAKKAAEEAAAKKAAEEAAKKAAEEAAKKDGAKGGDNQSKEPAVGDVVQAGDANYEIGSDDTVKYMGPTDKNKKSYTVPDTRTIGGKSLKVTSIDAKAFQGCDKMTKLVIGKNVKKIAAKALKGKKKLKKITIKAKGLTSVGNNAFSGLPRGAKIYMPKLNTKQKTKYKKLFKKKVVGTAKIVWKK